MAAPPLDVGLVPPSTEVAATNGAIPGYPAPGQPSNMTVPGGWYGYPSVLPVVAIQPDWLEVRLAQRPNGSTTWVQASDVTLSTTPYAIVIDLSTEHLTVYQSGLEIYDFPAGIGTPDDPTPTGSYFMTMKVPLIGTTGAAISHGCVRLHDADLALLTTIPAGTPINIIS